MNRLFKFSTLLLPACLALFACYSCSDSDEPESPPTIEIVLDFRGSVYSRGVLTDGEKLFDDYYKISKQAPENPVSVALEKAGTLSDVISDKTEGMDALKVCGPMNKADLEYVAEYAKQNYLIYLDLSLAQFSGNSIPDRAMAIIMDRTISHDQTLEICAGLPIFHLILPENIQKIGTAAFAGLMLMDLKLPKSVRHIGEYCFLGNAIGDGEFVIPNGVTTIPPGAFCSYLFEQGHSAQPVRSLSRIVLPSSVTSVGVNAFRVVQAKELELGNSIREIGNYAFFNNHAIETLDLPASLKSIGNGAFADLPALTNIYSRNPTPPEAGCTSEISIDYVEYTQDHAFNCTHTFCENCNRTYQTVNLHVPAGSLQAYSEAEGWRYFNKITER